MNNIKNEDYSILVNSSDGYRDCWEPFFTLLKKYWPEINSDIYLNTEKTIWESQIFPNLKCTQVEKNKGKRLTWSECLIAALEQVKTPYVLYFQEDYFIHNHVDADRIKKACEYMRKNSQVSHIALTKHCSYGPYLKNEEEWLQTIRINARYRISTQAAIWRVDTLRSYLDANENGWMFEIFGTWRASKRNDIFLSAKWDDKFGGPVIDYLHTGIIKGKWLKEIVPVFQKNNIQVDFSTRGFYEPKPALLHKYEVFKKIMQNPIHALRQLF